MAKAKTTKATETKSGLRPALRKGTLAYLGLYGFAYERAVKRAEQVKGLYKSATDGLFEELVERGETVEKLVVETAKTSQKAAAERFEATTEKVKAVLPVGANDRVEELQAEVEALNKKITALSKKASTPRKAPVKTEKTVKKAA